MTTPKSDKQKCLEMWQWLAAHPSMTKDDYRNHLYSLNLGYEYAPCWACRHAEYECAECPITWSHTPQSPGQMCCDYNSVYFLWYRNNPDKYKDAILSYRRYKAGQMVSLIKTTWEEE